MPTNAELLARIEVLERQIKEQDAYIKKVKEWSDLSDHWLQEMINSLTECVDKLMGIDHTGEED